MQRIYYSRENYNQLKRKQYEEYLRRQNIYYLYRKKYYEEYIKRKNRYYLYKKKQYEEYVKRQNRYYLYRKRYYEEYIRRQNRYYLNKKKVYEEYAEMLNKYYLYNKKYNKIDISPSEFLDFIKADNIEANYINNNSIKNKYGYIDVDIEESNLEYKKNQSYKCDYLENKICDTIESPSYNEKYLEENGEEFIKAIDKKHIEENNDNLVEENNEILIEENAEEFIKASDKKHIEENNENLIEENDEEFIEKYDEELIDEKSNKSIKEELSKDNDISIIDLYVKFPVILAETSTTIIIEDTITLNQEISVIKEIKKNVFLTQSRLIPFSSNALNPNSGILFITGFIRNKMEYETQTYPEGEKGNICRDIKHCTFDVPFNFTTRITFLRPPIFIENSSISEVEFFNEESEVRDFSKASVKVGDIFEQCFRFTEVFNEKPFIELVKSTFIEVDINKNMIVCEDSIEEQKSTKITEKIIVTIVLKVLQKQQLRVEVE